MPKIKRAFEKTMQRLMDVMIGNGLMQEINTVSGERYITPGMPELARECAREGIVLLENDGVLPFDKDSKVSVFGRVQHDWFYVGYGSGGDVHPPYTVGLLEGLKNCQVSVNEELKAVYDTWCESEEHRADEGWWGHWPYFHPEMPLEDSVVQEAAARSNVALVVIGRAAGEDRENTLKPGSYYLTEQERTMLRQVTEAFDKVVLVMNCGNIVDMSFVEEYDFSAVLYAWQLGQESGNALAEVLSGKVSPSGKLTDTIARRYEDYPSSANFGNEAYNNYEEDIYVGYRYFETFAKEKVLYPFGHGLSYTKFAMESIACEDHGNTLQIRAKVTNIGERPGKEVVQIYCAQPEGQLPKAARVLVGFGKTDLLQPKESQEVTIEFEKKQFASYDEEGIYGDSPAFVLEAGEYRFFLGDSVRADIDCGTLNIRDTEIIEKCHSVCAVDPALPFMVRKGTDMSPVYASGRDLRARILENMPKELTLQDSEGEKKGFEVGKKGSLATGRKNVFQLQDVKEGKCTLEEFTAQLSNKELSDLTHGEGGMGSPLGVVGNAGAFGGITEDLRKRGIPALITADGPAGIRIRRHATLLPCGTSIACTWNTELVERLFAKEGEEAVHFGVDVLLSPGMNIHRNPLCGRNFEYYSEDPTVSGKIAAAVVRGLQKGGTSACPKHFACNHQEVNRNQNDSRVSERALREIYLRNFEICVKESKPQNLMTSYNKINGVWSHYNYDLTTTVLRKEWGYEGNIVTDWWMKRSASPEFSALQDNAYRVRAQVDVLMPGNMSHTRKKYQFDRKQLETLGKKDGLTRAELQRTAMNVLRFALTRIG